MRAVRADTDRALYNAGFQAYQQQRYSTAVREMSSMLELFPESALRDMAIFWLAQALFKAGNLYDAAEHMASFYHHNPGSISLPGSVDEELVMLTLQFRNGGDNPCASRSEDVSGALDKYTG